jgi:hypothetical protein
MNILEVVQSVMLLVALKASRGKQSGDWWETGQLLFKVGQSKSTNCGILEREPRAHRITFRLDLSVRYRIKSDSASRVGQRKPSRALLPLQTTCSSPENCCEVSCSTPLCALVGWSGSRRRVRWFPITKVVESGVIFGDFGGGNHGI